MVIAGKCISIVLLQIGLSKSCLAEKKKYFFKLPLEVTFSRKKYKHNKILHYNVLKFMNSHDIILIIQDLYYLNFHNLIDYALGSKGGPKWAFFHKYCDTRDTLNLRHSG